MITIPPFSTLTNDQTGLFFTNKTAEPWEVKSLTIEDAIVHKTAPPLPPPPLAPAPPWIPIPPPARSGFKFSKPLPEGSPSKIIKFIRDDNGILIGAEVFEAPKPTST